MSTTRASSERTEQQRQHLWRNHLHRRLRRLYRSGLRPAAGPRRTGRPADALPDRRLQPALCQHRVELDPRVRELRERQGRRRLCHHFGEQPDHELAEHADPLRQLLRRLRQPSAPGRWQWRGHPEERRHQLRDRRPDRLPETQRHRLQHLWRRDRLAVSLANLDQQLVFEVAMVQPFGDSAASAPNRSTASVFAIRSRSTGPGCSAPMLPIRSSRTAKTTSASAWSSGGSFDRSRMTVLVRDGERCEAISHVASMVVRSHQSFGACRCL